MRCADVTRTIRSAPKNSPVAICISSARRAGHANGRTFDEPEFRPFWRAAEELGALIFFHQGGETLVSPRTRRYHLPNSIGNLVTGR